MLLARADAGRSPLREPVEILPVLEETCRHARALDPQRDIRLEAESLSICGDRDALKQVLLIGLDNALKHSNSPMLVTARQNGNQAEIRVRDFGPGISPETLERIFDRFFRGEESLTQPGLGLGLSIARSLTESMGGAISMESELGKGSALVISFFNDSQQTCAKPRPTNKAAKISPKLSQTR